MSGIRLSVAVALALIACVDQASLAAGIWGVPGSIGQCVGHGFGGGHHAPMVRAPLHHNTHVPRVTFAGPPRAATTTYYQAFCSARPTMHYSPAGCATGNCYGSGMQVHTHAHASPQAWSSSPEQILMAPVPVHAPVPASHREPPQAPTTPTPRAMPSPEQLPAPNMPAADPQPSARTQRPYYGSRS